MQDMSVRHAPISDAGETGSRRISMGGKGFTSTAFGSLDAKGRVCIPATFRQVLESQNTQGMFVCPTLLKPIIDCFGQELYEYEMGQYPQVNPLFVSVKNDFLDYFSENTVSLPFDSNGRVRLPDELIANAGLTDRVVFIGQNRKFQICTPEQHALLKKERMARLQAAMDAQAAIEQGKIQSGEAL